MPVTFPPLAEQNCGEWCGREVAATTLDQGPDDDEPLDWDNHPSLSPAERNPSLR